MILYPLLDSIGSITLVDRMVTDTALKVVQAARVSYSKESNEKSPRLCKFLWENGHTSPYRHSYFTFHWKAPLFVFRQAFKYQVGSGWREYEVDGHSVSLEVFDDILDTDKGCSWNEVSGRYTDLRKVEFYIPSRMRSNTPHGNKQASVEYTNVDHDYWQRQMEESCWTSVSLYRSMVDSGVAKEIARMILPQNIYSQAYWTVSLQGIMHFLDQRLKPDAQWEIRQYAQCIQELVKKELEEVRGE